MSGRPISARAAADLYCEYDEDIAVATDANGIRLCHEHALDEDDCEAVTWDRP